MSALRTAALGAAGQLSLGSLFVRLTLDSTQFTKGWINAEATMVGTAGTMTKALAGMTLAAGVALTAVGVLGVREAAKFEQSFAQVRRTVEATENQFALMAGQFRQLAKEIPVDVNMINKTAAVVGALGIPTKDIVEFTKVMTDMGATTNMTAEQAAKSMGRIANIMGNAGDEFGRMGSAVLKLGVSTAATESEITSMGMRIAGAGKVMGMTTPQVLGLAAALSSVGVRAEVGGTMMAQVMEIMARAAEEGGDALLGLSQIAGVSMAQFSKTIKTDATGAIVQFFEGLKAIDKEGGNVFRALDNVGIEGRRVAVHLLQAAGASEKLAGWIDIGTQAWEENSARTKATTEIYSTFISQLKLTWNNLKDIFITIGNELIPVLRVFNEMLMSVITNTDGMGNSFKAITESVAPALIVIFGLIGDVIYGWQIAIKAGEIAFLGFFLAISKFGQMTVAVIAGAAELFANAWIYSINFVIRGINKLLPEAKALAEIEFIKAKVDPELEISIQSLIESLKEAAGEMDALALKGSFSDRLAESYKKATQSVKSSADDTKQWINSIMGLANATGAAFDKVDAKATAVASRLPQMSERMRKAFLELMDITKFQEEGPKLGSDLSGKGSAMRVFQDPAVAAAQKLIDEQTVAQGHLDVLQEMNDKEIEMTKAMHDEKTKLIEEYNERLKDLQMAQAMVVVQSGQNMFDSLAKATAGFAGEQTAAYKAMFAASKAFAIAESIIKIQQGIAGAMGATPFYPVGLVNLMGVISASAGIVSTIQSVGLQFSGGRAQGGPVTPGQTFMVGEKGPELFSPSQGGTIIPNDRLGGGNTQVVINNYTEVKPEVTERMDGQQRIVEVMLRRVKSDISSEIRDGRGDVSRAMQSSFNLKRGKQ